MANLIAEAASHGEEIDDGEKIEEQSVALTAR